jgi:hypothetical protein
MTLYKLNRVLHRDLGYFCVALVLVYSISGIALNHRKDWNPNYTIQNREFTYPKALNGTATDMNQIHEILSMAGEQSNYKNHYFPKSDRLAIFVNGGNIRVDLSDGTCTLETIRKRPLFFEVNFLHYNPGVMWTWFADVFCVMLVFLAISGLFIVRGGNGLKWRGTVFMTLGIAASVLLSIYYLH